MRPTETMAVTSRGLEAVEGFKGDDVSPVKAGTRTNTAAMLFRRPR
jgi:hypothetical protein